MFKSQHFNHLHELIGTKILILKFMVSSLVWHCETISGFIRKFKADGVYTAVVHRQLLVPSALATHTFEINIFIHGHKLLQ